MGASFTKEELETAKSADLLDVARALGYTVLKIGKYYTIREMDSIRIYDNRSWYRFSDGTGGTQIDFLTTFTDMDFSEAVSFLLNRNGVFVMKDADPPKEKKFKLPTRAINNERIRTYLMKERSLAEATIDKFIGDDVLYEEKDHHNIVFVGLDEKGIPRCASMRGIYDRREKPFKCDAAGSDKSYGFHMEVKGSNTVRVFEGAIDLMSFYDATRLSSDHLLALGSTADTALSKYVLNHPEIRRVFLCLDNDEPGLKAAKEIRKKFEQRGFYAKILGSPKGYKDYNEWLIATRERQRLHLPAKEYRRKR